MKTNFDSALEHVLILEGGWIDHSSNPEGATMKGVSLMTFRRFYGPHKTKQNLKDITYDQLSQIYHTCFWDKCRCDDLPTGIDYLVFDAAVQSGPVKSIGWLQVSVGVDNDDGMGGPTISKVITHDPIQVIDLTCNQRLAFLRSLSTWHDFKKGWKRRVESVRASAVRMVQESVNGSSSTSAAFNYPIIKLSDSGPWVEKIQKHLGIADNGVFDNQTLDALILWQKNHGLEPDGIAGRNTYRVMGLVG